MGGDSSVCGDGVDIRVFMKSSSWYMRAHSWPEIGDRLDPMNTTAVVISGEQTLHLVRAVWNVCCCCVLGGEISGLHLSRSMAAEEFSLGIPFSSRSMERFV